MVQIEIILLLAFVNFIAGFIGTILIFFNKHWDEQKLHWGLGFSAGLLLAISLLEIIPTAIEMSDSHDIMIYTLIGFLAFFILEQFILIHHFDRHSDHGTQMYAISLSTLIALCIHAFLDGVVIGLGFEFNNEFGLIIFIGIIFHRLPLAVSLANLFINQENRNNALLKMTFFSIMAPTGLLISYFGLSGLSTEFFATMIAISAGMFIYIGATDMIPELSHSREIKPTKGIKDLIKKWEATFFIILGMLTAILPHLFLEE